VSLNHSGLLKSMGPDPSHQPAELGSFGVWDCTVLPDCQSPLADVGL